MTYNLIHERWIPVRGEGGRIERIAPWELTSKLWMDFAAPRPDFKGALAQFCIGLLQTACAPSDEAHWRQWFEKPPKPEELKGYFTTEIFDGFRLDKAFNLDGDGPRFMQDLEPFRANKSHKISRLLVDAPGDSTEQKNRDHFIKRDTVKEICYACASSALFTLQINASEGGRGHLTGMRGGGPLTTVIKDDNLWHTLWLNVLNQRTFKGLDVVDAKDAPDIFPWLAPTRTSEDDLLTTPADAHPFQMYWSMPRRIRLVFDAESEASCDLCGFEGRLVDGYFDKPYGVRYSPSKEQAKRGIKIRWKHFLTPYTVLNPNTQGEELSPRHPQSGGITYRSWLGIVENFQRDSKAGSLMQEPAWIVTNHRHCRPKYASRLWAFGYEMDSDNARCWYDSEMPLVDVDEPLHPAFLESVKNALDAADKVVDDLKEAAKRAWFGTPSLTDTKGKRKIKWKFPEGLKTDTNAFAALASAFWQATELDFYRFLQDLKEKLEAGKPREAAHPNWYAAIKKAALRLFEEAADTGGLVGDLKARVYARSQLEDLFDSPYLKNQILRLP